MQRASHAQREMPNARRRQHGATHKERLGPFKAGQLETRPVFCKGETGGEDASPVSARVQGTVPRHYGIVPMTDERDTPMPLKRHTTKLEPDSLLNNETPPPPTA